MNIIIPAHIKPFCWSSLRTFDLRCRTLFLSHSRFFSTTTIIMHDDDHYSNFAIYLVYLSSSNTNLAYFWLQGPSSATCGTYNGQRSAPLSSTLR